jgi:hypothetical protein
MTTRRLLVGLCLSAVAVVGPASAANAARTVSIPVDVQGTVQVDFTAGGPGCQRMCGSSGSITWDPSGQANLDVTERGKGSRRRLDASLFLLGGPGQNAPTTISHVIRNAGGGAPAVCSDARVNDLTFLDFSSRSASRVEARLATGSPDDSNIFRTRCGGPLERDLVAALPTAELDLGAFTRGGATIDLAATRPFAANGFAGTVKSSVQLRLGRFQPGLFEDVGAAPPPGSVPRNVIATYRVEQVAGTIVTSFSGGSESSLCNPLDSCGASGTVRLAPAVSSGRATFVASGPARRVSGRQLRAALGLRPGPLAPRVTASGIADWASDTGSVTESFMHTDGSLCTDTGALGGGFITFWVGPRRVFASYGRSSAVGPDLLRTRCPGPSILDAAQNHPLATGNVPRQAFRKPRVTITLTKGRPFESEPYTGETRPSITIVLRRVAVRERLGFDVLNVL